MSLVLNGTTGIVSANIQDGTITGSDIANNTITTSNINFTTGKVLQNVVASTSSAIVCSNPIPWDGSIPQNTEGDEVITASITPLSATSRLFIRFMASGGGDGSGGNGYATALFKDSNVNAIRVFVVPASGSNWMHTVHLIHNEISGSTTARTYKIRVGASAGAYLRINSSITYPSVYGGTMAAILEILEIEV